MYYETSKRTIIKTILWRIIATMNSYLILTAAMTHDNFLNAILMNITGFFVYFLFERVCNNIHYGKVKKKNEQ